MAALVWLLIPVMAVCVAGLWSSWAARKRTNGGGDAAGVAGYDAFRSAMERPGQPKAPVMSRIPDDAVPTDSAEPTESAEPSDSSGPVTAPDADSLASGALRTSAEQADTMLSDPTRSDPVLSEDPVFSDPTSERVPTGVTTDSPSRAAD